MKSTIDLACANKCGETVLVLRELVEVVGLARWVRDGSSTAINLSGLGLCLQTDIAAPSWTPYNRYSLVAPHLG